MIKGRKENDMKTLKEFCTVALDVTNRVGLVSSCIGLAAGITLLLIPDSKKKDEKED